MGDSFQFDFENSIAPQQNALPSSVTAPTGQVRACCACTMIPRRWFQMHHLILNPGRAPVHCTGHQYRSVNRQLHQKFSKGTSTLRSATQSIPFTQTVCTFWLRGLCMKGDTCGFLHQLDASRMPVCRTFARTGQCREADCPYKHDIGEVPVRDVWHLCRQHNPYDFSLHTRSATCTSSVFAFMVQFAATATRS